MTPGRIAELRALAAAATPGPWGIYVDGLSVMARGNLVTDLHQRGPLAKDDAAFIAAARSALPEALDHIEQLRGINGDLGRGVAGGLEAIARVRTLVSDWVGDPLREYAAEVVLAALDGPQTPQEPRATAAAPMVRKLGSDLVAPPNSPDQHSPECPL